MNQVIKKAKIEKFKTLVQQRNEFGVRFSEERACYVVSLPGVTKERTSPGLLPSLKKVFWPNYDFSRAKAHYRKLEERGLVPKSKKEVRGERRGANRIIEGRTRGAVMHRQLHLITAGVSKKEWQKEYFATHPFTERALEYLRQNGLTPVLSEVPVYDPVAHIATGIDMIAVDKNGFLFMLEWKSGGKSFKYFNGAMHGPRTLTRLQRENSAMNQAFVQLLFTRMILEKHHGIRVSAAYVLRVHETGVQAEPIPQELLRIREDMYRYFCDKRAP